MRHSPTRERHAASRSVAGFLDAFRSPLEGAAAERAWRTALGAVLVTRHLERPVDLLRVLEMAVVGALDRPIEAIRNELDPDNAVHLAALRIELDSAGTSEARLVQGLGALMDGSPVDFGDRFLTALQSALADAAASRAVG